MERSISIGPAQPRKVVHLERWPGFSETFPVGSSPSIQFKPKFPKILVELIDLHFTLLPAIVINFLFYGFCHLHFSIRILSFAFCHPYFIIRILSSVFYHPHFSIRHPVFILQRPFFRFRCYKIIRMKLVYYLVVDVVTRISN